MQYDYSYQLVSLSPGLNKVANANSNRVAVLWTTGPGGVVTDLLIGPGGQFGTDFWTPMQNSHPAGTLCNTPFGLDSELFLTNPFATPRVAGIYDISGDCKCWPPLDSYCPVNINVVDISFSPGTNWIQVFPARPTRTMLSVRPTQILGSNEQGFDFKQGLSINPPPGIHWGGLSLVVLWHKFYGDIIRQPIYAYDNGVLVNSYKFFELYK